MALPTVRDDFSVASESLLARQRSWCSASTTDLRQIID
jgi:hypothetical protein